MINIGDLVRNMDKFSGVYKNTFTIIDIIPSSVLDAGYYCYRNRRIGFFGETYLEKVNSPPRFAVGTVVTSKKSYSYPFRNSRFGVVQASNKVGSLIRVWNVYGDQIHCVKYVSNRNLREA